MSHAGLVAKLWRLVKASDNSGEAPALRATAHFDTGSLTVVKGVVFPPNTTTRVTFEARPAQDACLRLGLCSART